MPVCRSIEVLLINVDPFVFGGVGIIIQAPALTRRQLKSNDNTRVVLECPPIRVSGFPVRSEAAFCVYDSFLDVEMTDTASAFGHVIFFLLAHTNN